MKILNFINNNYERFAKIVIIISMMGVILTVLYYTYTSYIEIQTLKNQVKFVVDDLISDMDMLLLDPSLNKKIITDIENIKMSEWNIKSDEIVHNRNKRTIKKSVIMASVMGAFALLFIILSKYFKGDAFPMKMILGDTIVIILAIVIVEMLFATYLGSKFLNVDSNYMKSSVIGFLLQYAHYSSN